MPESKFQSEKYLDIYREMFLTNQKFKKNCRPTEQKCSLGNKV